MKTPAPSHCKRCGSLTRAGHNMCSQCQRKKKPQPLDGLPRDTERINTSFGVETDKIERIIP